MTITLTTGGWCYLYGCPDLSTGRNYKPGEQDMYGRIEPATGACYVYLTEGMRNGQHIVSRDLDISLVYPERAFVYGVDDNNETLDHPVLLEELKKMGVTRTAAGFWDPVIMYRGWAKGATTWYRALRAEANIGPTFEDINSKLRLLKEPYQVDRTPGMRHVQIYL